jgi:SRSO17 transposase
MADTPTVSATRFQLTLRLAKHTHDHASTVDAVVEVTNDLHPLFTAYEASVRAEALRDVRREVVRNLADRIDALVAQTGDPTQVAYLDGLKRYLTRDTTGRAMVTFDPPLSLVTP